MWTYLNGLSKPRKSLNKVFILMCFLLLSLSFSVNAQDEVYPVLMLDIGADNMPARTEPNFTSFTIADSGLVVDGITITLDPNNEDASIDSRWRGTPTGFPLALMYADFIFSRPGGMIITLEGLDPDTTYAITIYAYDSGSGSGGDRIADWNANGEYILTAGFSAGIPPAGPDDYASTGLAQTDSAGTLVLECDPNENTAEISGANNPYGFLNGLVVSSLTPITTARKPVPANGGILTSTAVELQWEPGQTAVSSNVYLGDDLDAVNDATTESGDIYLGNTGNTSFAVGSAGNPYPDGLTPLTTYYWRIDSVEGDGTVHTGDVWSFIVPPKEAFREVPVDTSLFNDPNLILTWAPGAGAIEHHVYFGDNLADVQAGTGGTDKGVVAEPNYVTGLLERNKTYYWRVDEFDGTDTHTGAVWSFTTTLDTLGTIDFLFWQNIAGSALQPLLDNGAYPDSPTDTNELTSFDTGDTIGADYGAQIEGWLYVPLTGDYTFWFSVADEGELLLSTNDDPGNAVRIAYEPVWGSYNAFSHHSDPIPLVGGNNYYIMARWSDGPDWDHCQVAWTGPAIRSLEIIQGNYLSPYDPVTSYGPVPNDTAVGVAQLPVLRWRPGNQAASHNIYLGTDPDALTQVATNQIGNETYTIVTPLDVNQVYYWRVDEINNGNPESPWVGKTWSFTTAPYLVVDDFEYYKTSGEPGDSRIFESWLDQWGFTNSDGGNTPGNGTTMTVGTDNAPFGPELTIVNTGSRQSLPLTFNNLNDPFYAETDRSFNPPQDWSQVGGQPSDSLGIAVRGRWGSPNGFTVDGSTYTVTGSGTDINGNADQFHFVYQALANGPITARVDSVQDTADFAKAGVMIRNGLNPDSISVGVYVTPSGRVLFQYREFEGDVITQEDTGANSITLPYWVRLFKQGNLIRGEMSADGQTWSLINDASFVNVGMFGDVYYGLAVTSNVDAGTPCEAVFSNVTGAAPTEELDIGLPINDPANLYVTLQNGGGPVTVINDLGTAAILTNDWMEWVIPLSSFTDQGLNLSSIRKMTIGIGNKQPNGAGQDSKVWIDDIRIYPAP